jgi:hypothetical protein
MTGSAAHYRNLLSEYYSWMLGKAFEDAVAAMMQAIKQGFAGEEWDRNYDERLKETMYWWRTIARSASGT